MTGCQSHCVLLDFKACFGRREDDRDRFMVPVSRNVHVLSKEGFSLLKPITSP